MESTTELAARRRAELCQLNTLRPHLNLSHEVGALETAFARFERPHYDPDGWLFRRLELLCRTIFPAIEDLAFTEDVLLSGRYGGADDDAILNALGVFRPDNTISPMNRVEFAALLDDACDRAIRYFRIPNDLHGVSRAIVFDRRVELLKQHVEIRESDPARSKDAFAAGRAKEAEAAIGQVLQIRDSLQEAAGPISGSAHAREFAKDAEADGRVAAGLSIGTIVCLIIAAGVAAWAVHDAGSLSWQQVVARLAFAVPALAVSAYLGRLSAHYRNASRWAKTAAVQLKSINAFNMEFTDRDLADETRAALGRRVFGEVSTVDSPRGADIEDLRGLIEAIAAATRRSAD